MTDSITINGASGEGGGQIVRTSLALAAVTGRPIVVENVRAKRRRPGLLRQHLTAFNAIAEICNGEVEGAELGARRIALTPREVAGGDYTFTIATAGSACLVLQTVLWPLLFANAPSSVTFEGGTHNSMAPPFDFLTTTFLPLLRRMGAKVEANLERPGFYPAGGGRFVVDIEPINALTPLELLETTPVTRTRARALIAELPSRIAERELRVVRRQLGWAKDECSIEVVRGSRGPGNVLMLTIQRADVAELVTAFGARGVSAEDVAKSACDEAAGYLDADVPVGEHLADQLLIPLALAGGGAFRTLPLTLHSRTNLEVVAELLGRRARIREERADCVRVEL